jgi:hypothetical protein
MAAGDHCLTLKDDAGARTLWEGFVITNNLGSEPQGTSDCLVRPDGGG